MSRMWPRLLAVALAVSTVSTATATACDLSPGVAAVAKSPGDNFYRLVVNGEIERYLPGQRYVVTLVGSRTHDVVQQFTRFQLTLEPLDPATRRSVGKQGQFQLFADTLTKFDDECTNSVVEADDLPKTEVQVMWKAPSSGSGCVLLKAMVYENATRWFAEDGQLTRRVCEDTSHNAPDCCACDDAKYKMVFEGIWSPETHPKDFPLETRWLTHFSDVIGATHPKNFTFWKEGEIATDGFRSLAEWGSVGLQERELRQRGNLLRSVVKAQGLWHPKVNSNTSATFFVDKRRHLLSLASMFGPSPDWVVGVSGLDLCRKDCSWVESQVVDLYPYDAGTDNGISYMSPNAETVPREKIYRITTMYPEDPRAPFYNPGAKEIPPLARLHLVREKLISKSCDEETLLSFVAEETDNAEAADRPECGVTEWGAWSACSVSCGKGLRMRTRDYRMPQKARMFSCERQLVSKEMCVAAVAECAEGAEGGETEGGEGEPLEESTGVCRVGEWGPWSECSVTCGAGVVTRRRAFLDHMGYKKCPLVAVHEKRKCMEAPCNAVEQQETADPRCPTTEWAEWSPCSASCGRGVRFRTRLLLVAPEQQRECSARVELVQQRACVEREECVVDMMTAKRMCMEEAQAGPCRGVFRRWHFDASRGVCAPFSYGGCRGSRNNFLSAEDCVSTCSVMLGGTPPGVVEEQVESKTEATAPTLANPNDCKLGPWGEWSKCSVQCGSGYQQRTRPILAEAGPGGVPCPARLTRRRRCSRRC